MGFTSILSTIGKDVKKVFAWVGTPQAQTLIATGEGVVEAIFPPATAIIAIGNTFMTEAIKVEALAAAAGQQNGSGAQKSAAVLNAATPEVLAFAQQYGLPTPTKDQLQQANNAIVAFLNAFPGAVGAQPASTTAIPAAAGAK